MRNEHDGYEVSAETFQAIIRERKAEKKGRTEENRMEILKAIRERKSKTGMDPLDQFPKEVWDAILDKLEQPKDLSNVSQVHHVFSDLLERRKVRDILFPQVVGLPFPTDRDPHRMFLPLARDLNKRAVSKSMRSEIDRWYEDNLLQHLQTGNNYVHHEEMRTICVGLAKSNVVKGLLENFVDSDADEPKANRFPLRSFGAFLTAYYGEAAVLDEEKQRFQKECALHLNGIRSHLEVIGDQIWHFQFIVTHINSLETGGITIPRIYDTLLELLELMPNLKWLELDVGEELYDSEEWKGVSIAFHLANHPFPTLKHLEHLDVELYSAKIEMFEIYEKIFSANRHVRRLHIGGRDDELQERLPVARVQEMESLESLCIGNEFDSCFNWRSIQSLFNFEWHLKQIQFGIKATDVTLAEVFTVLENLPTLEQVALNIINVRITGNLKFLALPNLTNFELRFYPVIDFQSEKTVQFFFSLQFLLYCRKLKKLRWESRAGIVEHRKLRRFMTNREYHERMINFRGGYRNLNYSNVWDVFRELDTIRVDLVELNPGQNTEYCRQRMEYKRGERDLPN